MMKCLILAAPRWRDARDHRGLTWINARAGLVGGNATMSPSAENAADSIEILVEPMRVGDITLVWPLVRAAAPTLRISAWQRYARALADREVAPGGADAGKQVVRRRGIMLARRRSQRFPCGLVCYQVKPDRRFGSVMTAEHLIAIDLVDPRPVVRALVEHLEAAGRAMGCGAVRSVVHRGGDDITFSLLAAGLRPEGTTLTKNIEAR